jgi:holliday junction DNA helicase RuvA
MISRLRGILLQKQPPHLLLDVGGVGYELDAPMSTFYDLPEVGKEVVLHTHLSIKEDAHSLYGFGTESDRALFRTLLKITGVGAKTALAVLSGASADEFAGLIQRADITALTRIPGVGKKTAERMIVELKDKLGSFNTATSSVGRLGAAVAHDPLTEASIALTALGYKPNEVQALLKKIDTKDLSAEALIRRALQAALTR